MTPAPHHLVPATERLAPITLVELDHVASLQTRVDRKYIVERDDLDALLDDLDHRLTVLDINGRRSFAYESVYFDTPSRDSYLGAARKRRNRFKVRTRTYLDADETMLEVKVKGRRNVTVKHRRPHGFTDRTTLDSSARAFVDAKADRPGLGSRLRPALTTSYLRTTLVDLEEPARLTIDAGLRCTSDGRSVGLGDRLVVEIKSTGSASVLDRWFWSQGSRPDKISKFGAGTAALHPELPANKWHRTINRHFISTDAARHAA